MFPVGVESVHDQEEFNKHRNTDGLMDEFWESYLQERSKGKVLSDVGIRKKTDDVI